MSLETHRGFGLTTEVNGWQVQEKIISRTGMNIDAQLDVYQGDFVSITAFKRFVDPRSLFAEFALYGFLKAESATPLVFLSQGMAVMLQLAVPYASSGKTAILEVKWYDGSAKEPISTMTIQLDSVRDTDKGPATDYIAVI